MSSATVQSTSANSRPFRFLLAAGCAAAAVQTLFLREYLSIFSGNELVIGVIFALWLCAAAAGSYAGSRMNLPRVRTLSFLYLVSVMLGFLLLRASRLLFLPGEVIPPAAVAIIVMLTQSDAAFFGGFAFGRLARCGNGGRLYLAENAGAVAGLLIVAAGVIAHVSNGIAVAGVLALFALTALGPDPEDGRGRLLSRELAAAFIVIAGFVFMGPVSLRWKYGQKVDRVLSGYEGEIALSRGEAGTGTFLNSVLYRAGMSLPSIEQAVHLPAAMHAAPLRRALVVGNAGQVNELRKYAGLSIECLETEPLLATGGCTCGAAEGLKPYGNRPFDLILSGSGMPSSGAVSRFYTLSFFKKMRTLTDSAGVFSFTLPLSGNYLSQEECRLRDLLCVTLSKAFRHVLVVPGEGYTFVASDKQLPWPVKPLVRTEYLEAYTLASLTPERLSEANRLIDSVRINTIDRPYSLLLAQQQWLGLFKVPFFLFLGALTVLFLVAIAVLPKTRAALSVGTSGFAAGVYSVALLLVYQFFHGTLYSSIAVLMVALTIGFALGSRVKRFPFSDAAVGLYAALTLAALTALPFPPLALFCVFHAGMGFLAGAQFVTRQGTPWGGLYAADLAGGVFGMALCSTLLVPYFGVTAVAVGLGALKLASAAAARTSCLPSAP
jgi:spermidine synthase